MNGDRTFSRQVYDLITSAKMSNHKVRLNEAFRLDLKWWLVDRALSVYSDSSKFGLGALHGKDWVADTFNF